MKLSRLDALVIKIRIDRMARIATIDGPVPVDGLRSEVWDLGSDEFLLEAWELMAFGGVHVRA
jgi:hypothetical protein